jgi:hydrogenase nickel incorporation protein HypA/HybF
MHEASIAQSILDIAIRECSRNGYERIERIKVEIGLLNSIHKDSLLFAFNALKTNTIAESAQLDIEEKPVGGHCNDCERYFTTNDIFVFSCPLCGGMNFSINQGRELNIIEMEVK